MTQGSDDSPALVKSGKTRCVRRLNNLRKRQSAVTAARSENYAINL
jgi:hypothetical protein